MHAKGKASIVCVAPPPCASQVDGRTGSVIGAPTMTYKKPSAAAILARQAMEAAASMEGAGPDGSAEAGGGTASAGGALETAERLGKGAAARLGLLVRRP